MEKEKYARDSTEALINKLNELGDNAQRFFLLGSFEEKGKAFDEFIEFFDSIPEQVKNNPKLANDRLIVGVISAGIKFGRLDNQEQVSMTTGGVLNLLDLYYSGSGDPVSNHLMDAIRFGGEWKKIKSPEVFISRVEALKITRWTVKAAPKFATPELTRVVTEAAFLPYATDESMIEIINSYLEVGNRPTPERVVAMSSGEANRTLLAMLPVNRRLAMEAFEVVQDIENSIDHMFPLAHRPILCEAVKQTRSTIVKAVKRDAAPTGLPVQNYT